MDCGIPALLCKLEVKDPISEKRIVEHIFEYGHIQIGMYNRLASELLERASLCIKLCHLVQSMNYFLLF